LSRPRVLVVRSGAKPFPTGGEDAAVEVVERVTHTIDPITPPGQALAGSADLAIFTSRAAVERVAADPHLASLFLGAAAHARVAAVGPVTAEALRERGVEPHLVASGSGEALLERLPNRLDGWRVLLPCGEDSAKELPEGLRRRGAQVERVVVYRKVPRAPDAGLELEVLERPFAAFCATSPSAAGWLFEGLAQCAAERLRRTPAVVLGRSTCRYLEARGVDRIALTEEPRFSAALRLLEQLATAPGGA
jgi:uroporphyrinogen III methyltransferase / synthase